MSGSRMRMSRAGQCVLCGIRYYCPDLFDTGYCSERCEQEDPAWR